MITTKHNLETRKQYLKALRRDVEGRLENAPDGTLRTSMCNGYPQYYHRRTPSDRKGRYLRASERKLAVKLAQKDYDEKLLKAITKEIDAIDSCLANLPENMPEEIYDTYSQVRKQLITPIEEPDDVFVKRWMSVEYNGKPFDDDSPELYSDKGERMRSKSEVIIANILSNENIPYRYEYPLYLQGLGTVYPDFTVLNVRMHKEYIWEHRGMMDDPAYLESAIRKETVYNLNGIYRGDRLIMTDETKLHPVNIYQVHGLIELFLK